MGVNAACQRRRAVLRQPLPEWRIADQAVLRHLRVTREQFAARQRGKRIGVGQHKPRLIERADEVLAGRHVDAGLAADRAVDLSQQRGGDLDEIDAAQQDRRRETGKIADHAAAQRDNLRRALAACRDHGVQHMRKLRDILAGLAGRNDGVFAANSRCAQIGGQGVEVQRRHVAVGDDINARLRQDRLDHLCRTGQQTASDMDRVGLRAPNRRSSVTTSAARSDRLVLLRLAPCGLRSWRSRLQNSYLEWWLGSDGFSDYVPVLLGERMAEKTFKRLQDAACK